MSRKKRSILNDPRYPDFVARYWDNLPRYVMENSRQKPTWQQCDVMQAINQPGCRVAVASGHGCFGRGTKVLMFNGSIRNVEDIKVGDILMGDDNTPRTVLELKRGREPMYQFEYMDKTNHVFNESHILCLVATQTHGKQTTGDHVTVTVRNWLLWSGRKQRTHAIYRRPAEFPKKRLLIPPYIMGLWLGDGSSTGYAFTNPEPLLKEAWSVYLANNGMEMHDFKPISFGIKAAVRKKRPNKFRRCLGEYGLINNKHIPHDYLTSCTQDRLELLAGLLDTDGYLYNKGRAFEITQKRKSIAEGIVFLSRSLGMHASITEERKGCMHKGTMRTGTYYKVHISRNVEKIPCRLPQRKPVELDNPQRPNLHFGIRKVEFLGEGDYFGFILDGNSKFLGGDFTVLHNTGKSKLLGLVLDWHVRTFPMSNLMLTANNLGQCRIGVWKYLDESIADMDFNWPWMSQYIIKETQRYYVDGHKDSWFCVPKTAGKGNPQGLAGFHNKHYMVVADEASEIDDVKFDVIEGALTQPRNRYVMISQPTRIVGRFAECWSILAHIFTTFNLNAEESPLVDKAWISQQLAKYGGHHSPQYQIRVLGRMPDNLSGMLIPLSWLEEAQSTEIEHTESWGWVLTSDVAEGMFRDSSVWILAKVSGYGPTRKVEIVEVFESLDRDELAFARELYVRLRDIPNVTVAVDADGCGRTVVLTLRELGVNVDEIHWGLPCHSQSDQQRYKNLRAYASVKAREAFFENRIRITRNKKLIEQGAKIPYVLDERGRYTIRSKEWMRANGIKSPDLFDALCFLYLVDYVPVGDEVADAAQNALLQQALEMLKTGGDFGVMGG